MWVQLNLFPSAFYRRQTYVLTALGLRNVMAGPFAGMAYGPMASDKAVLSRLLGSYEKETYPAVEHIIASKPDLIVVAGAGRGILCGRPRHAASVHKGRRIRTFGMGTVSHRATCIEKQCAG